ncbi:hypothetical protein [Mycobacterium lentiflavum]|uniref:hypothetical protein n=1 Tax=Mycobacterium lentiflavum TaxID=141349 RepID=UPI0011127AED|nr:hypothetical protein [Mycobacterium lentiflavum]
MTIVATTAMAVVIAGCCGGTANGEPPDTSTCYDLGGAKDNLMLASKPETARKAADTLEKYSPPDAVKAAIEHFVTTVGAQPSDPTLDVNRSSIANWLKQMCPMLNTY